MRFLSPVIGSLSSDSRARRGTASTGRRRSRIELETLDNRNLLSIAGVTLQFGNLAITAPKASGNVAEVRIDPTTHNVEVSLNGKSEEFAASKVHSVSYKGGVDGGDTFVNDTNLLSLDFGYGGNNDFTGGTAYNFVFFQGNSNTYTVHGTYSDVFEDHGLHDSIVNPSGARVSVYSF